MHNSLLNKCVMNWLAIRIMLGQIYDKKGVNLPAILLVFRKYVY